MVWQENDATAAGATGNGDYIVYNLSGVIGSRSSDLEFQIADRADFLPTDDYAVPGHYHFGGTGSQVSVFSIYDGAQPLAYGQLYATDLVVTGGVPEPAAWSLLIAGFAAVGAALRRRADRSTIAHRFSA